MDQSLSESDISMSPSQLLERLQLLRQLQLLQRGKLQKQRLEYRQSPESCPKLSEIVSHFTTSTSYETFRSLLQTSEETRSEKSLRHNEHNMTNISQKVKDQDLVDGVGVLNLSQESEVIINSPVYSRSKVSSKSNDVNRSPSTACKEVVLNTAAKVIQLDELPILTPKKDFETLLLEKIGNENKIPGSLNTARNALSKCKKPFLRRGEGIARFGLRNNGLVIQSTKSLPWKRKSIGPSSNISNDKLDKPDKSKPQPLKTSTKNMDKPHVKISVPQQKKKLNFDITAHKLENTDQKKSVTIDSKQSSNNNSGNIIESQNCELHGEVKPPPTKLEVPIFKKNQITSHPLFVNEGKTWAAVLTNEQGDFLRQLKQTDFYKNYASPAKSITSDISCDENLVKLRQEKEAIEQNMFELLENKVSHESFNLDNSFFHRFFQKTQLECSGESTPLVLQKCLAENPKLLHLPSLSKQGHCETTPSQCGSHHCDVETNDSEYTDCDHETCSSVSECCSCKTVEEASQSCCPNKEKNVINNAGCKKLLNKEKIKEVIQPRENVKYHKATVTENDNANENMSEMNAKLVATSELLKERLGELEDEIETFRQENNNLTKIREELDQERQKFYEDKANFEQKFNEEKILSEYYLSEEKEKLEKQKQVYERYVREMRGRLNKKDKDEVTNLKKEISDLREEIRIKDAKSTTTIARLRNQLKIAEREKTQFQEEIEKLKKVNKRLHHSNEMTRRMTNIKYLQEINRKLHTDTKEILPEINLDSDAKYKGFEIERQSRSRKVARQSSEPTIRARAKSVPNLKVTSRYAKYFSQRDTISQMNENKTLHVDHLANGDSDDDKCKVNEIVSLEDSGSIEDNEEEYNDDVENNLEKLYNERFQSVSPKSTKSCLSNCDSATNLSQRCSGQSYTHNGYFLRKSSSTGPSEKNSVSPRCASPELRTSNGAVSPISVINQRTSNKERNISLHYNDKGATNLSTRSQSPCSLDYKDPTSQEYQTCKSPVPILSNRSSGSQKCMTQPRDVRRIIDPSSSKSSLSKTSLNPTEIKGPDGTRELRFPNGNIKFLAPDGKYTKFVYYNGDIKENFYNNGTIKYFYAETKTYHTTHADGLEVLEFPE